MIEQLNRGGGFMLTKFISNLPGLLEELGHKSNHKQVPKEIGSSEEQSSTYVLNLNWDHVKDTLVVNIGTKSDSLKAVTHRLVLSLVSKVFDSVGLVAPFTVEARLLLKDVWRLHCLIWEDLFPREMIERVSLWSSEVQKLGLMTIPRS